MEKGKCMHYMEFLCSHSPQENLNIKQDEAEPDYELFIRKNGEFAGVISTIGNISANVFTTREMFPVWRCLTMKSPACMHALRR